MLWVAGSAGWKPAALWKVKAAEHRDRPAARRRRAGAGADRRVARGAASAGEVRRSKVLPTSRRQGGGLGNCPPGDSLALRGTSGERVGERGRATRAQHTRPPCPKSIHEWKRGSPPGGFRRQFPTAPGFIVPPTSSRRNHHAASIRDGTLSPDPGGSTLPLPHARLSRAHRFAVATGAGSRGSRGRQSVAVPGGAA
jgi:hypothetical protein